ncbi:MAG: HAMP domain-containing protein [Butyricicoccus sp.]
MFTTDTIRSMQEAAAEPGTDGLKTIIDAHKSRLGIDDYRNYAILDSEGGFLDGSNPNVSVTRTSNVIAAMAGETGTRSAVSDSIMDIAVPLDKNGDGAVDYIVYIADNKREISDLSWRFFQIVMQAMMFGLLAAILLSFLLSKTITTPIERITEGARSIAEGNFDQDLGVQSSDEIGELTRSFNYMAHRLKNTVGEVQGERDKLNTLFLHMTDGVAAFTTDGTLIHMNPATENLWACGEQKLSLMRCSPIWWPDRMKPMRSFLTNEITRRAVLSLRRVLRRTDYRARHRGHSRCHRAAPSG